MASRKVCSCELERGHATWRIAEYVEPSWEEVGEISPILFWRARKGAALGYIRDGELFDARWVYICDASKATHFSEISAPDPKVVELDTIYLGTSSGWPLK